MHTHTHIYAYAHRNHYHNIKIRASVIGRPNGMPSHTEPHGTSHTFYNIHKYRQKFALKIRFKIIMGSVDARCHHRVVVAGVEIKGAMLRQVRYFICCVWPSTHTYIFDFYIDRNGRIALWEMRRYCRYFRTH